MLPRDDGSVPEALLPSWPPLGTRGSGPLLAALRNQHSNCGSEGTEWKMVSATIPPSRFWKAGSLHFVENKELEFWGCEELLKLLQQANKTTLLFQGSESWTEKPAAQCDAPSVHVAVPQGISLSYLYAEPGNVFRAKRHTSSTLHITQPVCETCFSCVIHILILF